MMESHPLGMHCCSGRASKCAKVPRISFWLGSVARGGMQGMSGGISAVLMMCTTSFDAATSDVRGHDLGISSHIHTRALDMPSAMPTYRAIIIPTTVGMCHMFVRYYGSVQYGGGIHLQWVSSCGWHLPLYRSIMMGWLYFGPHSEQNSPALGSSGRSLQ